MHLFAPLAERAAAMPDQVFCRLWRAGRVELVTAGAIMAEARGLAGRLRDAGVGAGRIVPIVLEHRRELYSSFIACTLIGAVPAFLPPLTRKQDPAVFAASMQALLARLEPPCAIVSAATRVGVPVGVVVDVDLPDVAAPVVGMPVAAGGEVAFLQHSSGTTGLKKGVMLSHATVLGQIAAYAAAIGLREGDGVASWLPLYHDMGLITCFLLPAVAGVPIASLDALEWVVRPGLLFDAAVASGASLCWLPNFAFHHMVRVIDPEARWDLAGLRMVVNCSEPCRAAAFDVFLARFGSCGLRAEALQVSYAMAENVFAVTQTEPGQVVRRARGFLSSGRAVAGSLLRVGAGGEIEVGGASLFAGYHAQPELTAARLRDGWYQTGDLGFIEAGELFVIGRSDDVLVVNGKKLVAHEIEDALHALPGIAPGRVLVFAEHDEAEGASRLVVAAEPLGDDPALAAAIRRAVAENCGVRPHRVSLVDRGFLLKSTSGKISRAASIAKLQSKGFHRMSDTLARLADVARTTFKAPGAVITPETTADDVDGWDSLSHALFLMNLERAFAVRFDAGDVIDLENVGELVRLIDGLRAG